ncbi:MAG TPA: DUF4397 domain-containing protein [Gemmatimonadaceae bacterium]|nr:DUF4397 domain-containing protein [Gemmatimonadaceae bacterium]
MPRRLVATLLASASLLLAACDDDDPTSSRVLAEIRGANASAATPTIDVLADVPPVVILGDIAFNSSSGDCARVPQGDLVFTVRAHGGTADLATTTQTLVGETRYTLLFLPNNAVHFLLDDAENPAANVARLRFINAAGVNVDVYVTEPNASLFATTPRAAALTATPTTWIDVPTSNNHIRFTPNTSERVLLDIPSFDFGDRIVTVVLTRTAAGALSHLAVEPCS